MIDPATHIGPVRLTIADLDRSIDFYTSRLGLTVAARGETTAELNAGGSAGTPLLRLDADARAPRVKGTTGLYHFALLVPSRVELARSLRRLVEQDTRLQGASDHGVSEALYLADPDGNGIEIYRDRPRAEWPMSGGSVRMGTAPLDLDDLLSHTRESDRTIVLPIDAGTVMGHVHLHVASLAAAESFYVGVLGFAVMQRYGPSALFVSAGGYHHHVGLNTWAGVGAPPPPPGAIGLRHFVVRFPDDVARQAALERLSDAGVETEPADFPDVPAGTKDLTGGAVAGRNSDAPNAASGGARLVKDPSGNVLLLA